jgi:hypothetical protein
MTAHPRIGESNDRIANLIRGDGRAYGFNDTGKFGAEDGLPKSPDSEDQAPD